MQNTLCSKQERQLVFIQFASCLFVDVGITRNIWKQCA